MLLNFEALDEVHGVGQGSELVSLPFYNNNFFLFCFHYLVGIPLSYVYLYLL